MELEVLPLVAPNQSKVCFTVCKTIFVRIQTIKIQAQIIKVDLGYLPQGEKHLAQAPTSHRCLLEWEEVLPNFLVRPKKKGGENKTKKKTTTNKQINNNKKREKERKNK